MIDASQIGYRITYSCWSAHVQHHDSLNLFCLDDSDTLWMSNTPVGLQTVNESTVHSEQSAHLFPLFAAAFTVAYERAKLRLIALVRAIEAAILS